MPVGGLAVPRSNSVDTAVSMAIFNNEDELLKGAFRAFPKLKTSKDKFEYGYRLREFPEDEVRAIAQHAASLLPPRTRTALATRLTRLTPSAHPPHTATGQGGDEGRGQGEHQPLHAPAAGEEAAAVSVAPLLRQQPGGCARCSEWLLKAPAAPEHAGRAAAAALKLGGRPALVAPPQSHRAGGSGLRQLELA